ncbi:MAG: Glu-tRNA(Gln) amidotransferase GatDE subunit D [Euryarchaeota archaeon]|nr:Glu-tRNA(Gln) amidotransferase GatDE subunit D [Euryarchaeota archaeon]
MSETSEGRGFKSRSRHQKASSGVKGSSDWFELKRAIDGLGHLPFVMESWPKPGTPIRLIVKTWSGKAEHMGIALPSSGSKLVTIKLQNGYNVSFPESYVESFDILEDVQIVHEEEVEETPQDENLPLVHLIHTGGTIASKVDYATGAVSARFDPHELLEAVPELRKIARIRAVKLGNMWSDDLRPRHWNRMLRATEEAFSEGAVGCVITHGTDTLHLSAAAMSYGWSGQGGRPPGRIVLTGSQRSPDRGSSDAAENLIASVYWAANGPKPSGYRDSAVAIMHAESSDGKCSVLPGCSCRKYHSSRRDAFKSINQEDIGQIIIDREEIRVELSPEAHDARVEAISPKLFDEGVRIAQFISDPHLHPDQVQGAIDSGFDALLFHGTGLGHLPISDSEEDSIENSRLKIMLEDHILSGGVVVVVTNTIHGPVNLNVYSKGREQQEIGIIGHDSLCPPGSALVKLHHLLSIGGKDIVEEGWNKDLVGENPPYVRS